MPRTARGLRYEVTDLRAPWLQEKRAGRPLVFHHGVGASLDIFVEWLPIVATRHPVARFDMRGFGQSVVPPESHEWTMPELIADLLEVAETAFGREPVHVMGESIGGTIALAAGLRHASRLASVAMSNAAIEGGQIAHAPGWRAQIAREGIKGWSDRLMEMRFLPGAIAPEAHAWFAGVQERSPAHAAVGLGELLVGTDLAADLATLELPLLLMMPDRSPYVSLEQASTLADLVPHAEIAVFPGARHGLPFSHATAAAGLLVDFLARVESGGLRAYASHRD
jgi:3-oxoadipate enol-lactonase